MSRPRKLSKWILLNARGRYDTITQAAADLGVGRNTLYAACADFDVPSSTLLRSNETVSEQPAAPTHAAFEPPAAALPPTVPTPDPVPVEPSFQQLEALGISPQQYAHSKTCSSLGCGICTQVAERLRQRAHTPPNCWCGREHSGNQSNALGGPSPRPSTHSLAMSYAPPKRNGK